MITFNGVSSNSFGALVFWQDTDSAAAEQYDPSEVPGRSGDLLFDLHRRPNMPMVYDVVFPINAMSDARDMIDWLHSQTGYHRLTDSEHGNEFYLAYVAKDTEPRLTRDRTAIKFEVEFSRKPQRFLLSGETEIPISLDYDTTTATITNPTRFDALPLLDFDLEPVCSININGQVMTFTHPQDGNYRHVIVDCDLMDCYALYRAESFSNSLEDYERGHYNLNPYLTLDGYTFPRLSPGENQIIMISHSIEEFTVKPRWYRL